LAHVGTDADDHGCVDRWLGGKRVVGCYV
jgi:hypothetical protein